MTKKLLTLVLLSACFWISYSQQLTGFKVGKLKYNGGGDWYANPSSLKNLFTFIAKNTRASIYLEEEVVDPGNSAIFQYPMLYATGHGNILFDEAEATNLRKYLLSGGFLLIDDNYGLHQFAKREMKKVFPEYDFKEIPFSHPIYKQHFLFPKGPPKIHEHDGKPAQFFGIFHENRLLCILTYECDLGDGWEDPEVHHDPEDIRLKALQMGTNIILYVISR
ncbi:MAG: DUF4159 domain-containing protein [Bacteroidia bacterium]|nr:DUF4159 domain-containing protein [Bacteroidia bacterium]